MPACISFRNQTVHIDLGSEGGDIASNDNPAIIYIQTDL